MMDSTMVLMTLIAGFVITFAIGSLVGAVLMHDAIDALDEDKEDPEMREQINEDGEEL